MPKPVKDEIFGSRKSILKQALNVRVFQNIFFATCLRRLNPDPATRYILLRECLTMEEYKDPGFADIIPFLRDSLPLGNILFGAEKIQIRNLRSNTGRVLYGSDQLAALLLSILKCNRQEALQASSARIIDSEEVSALSRFLRGEMYGRAASSDIDFAILNSAKDRLTFIEEKLYTHEKGGSIGHGQYLSFRELLNDAFSPGNRSNIRFYLLFFRGNAGDCYCYDFFKEFGQPPRSPSFFDARRKEQRIIIPFAEMEGLAMGEFLGKFVFE